MENDGTALPFVVDLHPHAENIPELPLKRVEISIYNPNRIGSACARVARICAVRFPLTTGAFLRLPNGQPPGHDLASESLGIICCSDGSGVAHADIASHQRLAHELRKI